VEQFEAFFFAPAFIPSVWVATFGKLGQPGRMTRGHRPTPRRPAPLLIARITDSRTWGRPITLADDRSP